MKDVVDRLESEFKKEGAEIEQVQKMDKRQFAYSAGPLDAGFFVNFIFHAEPDLVTKLRSKFKLDPEVYRQHYQRLREKSEKKESSCEKRRQSRWQRTGIRKGESSQLLCGTASQLNPRN